MTTHVLDSYYLAITLLVTVGFQLSGFAIAWSLQFDKITDLTGGSNFFVLALLTFLLGDEHNARNVVASVLVMVWAVRIAGFLFYRVLVMGGDTRFDDIRASFLKFLGFWIGQILWVWTVSLPVTILNSPAISERPQPDFGTSRDIAGIVLWGIGWIIESVADLQKLAAKRSKGPPKKVPFQAGLWRYSRHPPYFGEILCWWGIWTLCISPWTNGSLTADAESALRSSVVSPLFTTILLLFGSGLPTAEKPQGRRFYLMTYGPDASEENRTAWGNYQEYLKSTSILIPIPPSIYRPIPKFLKKTVLLDFPVYQFAPEKDETS